MGRKEILHRWNNSEKGHACKKRYEEKKYPPINCIVCGQLFKRTHTKCCSDKCRIKSHVETDENGCWNWTGSISNCGYGKTRLNGKDIASHRASYKLFKGEIPDGLVVCHSCDNKACVNPDHLWVATQKENILDAKRKGLLPDQPRKLNFNQAIEVKRRILNGEKMKALSKEFNISITALSNLFHGITYQEADLSP